MILGIVKGTVVATRKMPELVGYKFLLVEPVFGSKKDTIVAGDNMGPAKLRKAEKLGVKIISEEEFIAMVGGQEAPAANGTEADSATTANTRGRNNGAPAATESGDGEPVQQGELF